MQKIAFTSLLCAILICQFALAQTYQKVRIDLGNHSIEELVASGLLSDHAQYKQNQWVTGVYEQNELEQLVSLGYRYTVLIPDMKAWYRQRNENPDKGFVNPNNPQHICGPYPDNIAVPALFSHGSMGGFYTWSEAISLLDTLQAHYPGLISVKEEVSTIRSLEDRPIWYVKLSDNADVDENETEVLYTSIHHSQEPASLQQLMFFMMYMLENYGTDEEVTYILDNLELYLVPFVNPDGYVYNETTDPGGGGLWRKNRRDNGFFSFGVDLNRNYGYEWGYDNIGSQPIGSSPWYRGDSAFSEPEAQAMKDFIENHDFKTAINWHSFGNFIIYPWNYRNIYTADSTQFLEYAREISATNHYRFGTVAETYGYQSNGDADDWAYGETGTKSKIISMTAEIGTMDDDFWPDTSRITPLCIETVDMNMKWARLSLAYARVSDNSPGLISGYSGSIPYSVLCLGLDTPSTFTISFTSLSPEIVFQSPPETFAGMALLEERSGTATYQTSGNPVNGQEIRFIMAINNGQRVFNDTITKIWGQPVILVSDSCENTDLWDGDDWGYTSEKAFSGNGCITDSPGDTYGLLTTSTYTLQDTIDLTDKVAAWIAFMTQWDIERYFDYVKLEVSADFGSSWTALCGHHAAFGSDDLDFPEPVYDGKQSEWLREEVNLSDYLGAELMLRFRLVSDQSNGNFDGFYFDDFQVIALEDQGTSALRVAPTEANLKVYPNPTDGFVNIEMNSVESAIIELINTNGVIIFRKECTRGISTIDISGMAGGIYTFRVFGEGINQVGRIAVMK
ncbi:MAG: immune inhibitor A [Bacteroidetes bacterium]|nr:immune inhibitor A [Bacteroidota bacterium]